MRFVVQTFLLFLVTALPIVSSQGVLANEKNRTVLVLMGSEQFDPAGSSFEEALRANLTKDSPVPIELYKEHLDPRTSDADYEREFVGLLQRKYAGRKFDLIIAVLDNGVRLLLRNPELFPDTPVVFYFLDRRNLDDLELGSNVTGIWSEAKFGHNLDLALTLHPNTKKVVVLAGISEFDKYWAAKVREDFRSYEDRLEITYSIGLTIAEQRQALANLSRDTIVMYTTCTRDNAGNRNYNVDVLRQISPASSAPIYGTTDTQLGNGIIGGSVMSFEVLGAETAKLGLRVMSGEKPQAIAPFGIPNVDMFDWRQLQRWGIDEGKLPTGSVVRYRQPSVWEQYKWRIVGAIALIILQALLIVGLLLNRAKRRRAEEEVRLSENRFRHMADSAPVLIWMSDKEPLVTFVNKQCTDFTGLSMEAMLGERWLELIHEDDRQRCIDIYNAAYARKEPFVYEYRIRHADGEFHWLYSTSAPRFASNGEFLGYIGSCVDITDRKLAEESVRESEARFRDMADSSAILIWIADENMLCTYFNKQVLDFTGRTMEELVGERWLEVVHEDDRQRSMEAYAAGYESKEQFILEFRLRAADGEYHWIYDTGAPRFASNGELLGYIGSAIDITDRRNAEQALQIAHEEVNKLKNQLEAENIYLQEEIRRTHNVDEIVGESNAIKYVMFKIEQVAQTDTTVLILGETGTGKELVARAIHNQSTRKDRPLVKVNCAALSASLIESELFGHEKGAFTGATGRKIGRFELADGATIFLDEIGELPLELQPKLLRVIQEGEIERLGSTKTIKVDVRLIAATNRNLKEEVERGTFREDLWYRLNVFPVTLPPLRQRKEDIPLMVEHFASVFSKKVGKNITSISSATMKKFQEHSWPGNVRELSNVVERALVTASGTVLHVVDQFEQPKASMELVMTLEEIEREHITRILDQTSWRVEGPSGAARILGLNPSTLRTRMGKLGIQKSIRSLAQSSKQQN